MITVSYVLPSVLMLCSALGTKRRNLDSMAKKLKDSLERRFGGLFGLAAPTTSLTVTSKVRSQSQTILLNGIICIKYVQYTCT